MLLMCWKRSSVQPRWTGSTTTYGTNAQNQMWEILNLLDLCTSRLFVPSFGLVKLLCGKNFVEISWAHFFGSAFLSWVQCWTWLSRMTVDKWKQNLPASRSAFQLLWLLWLLNASECQKVAKKGTAKSVTFVFWTTTHSSDTFRDSAQVLTYLQGTMMKVLFHCCPQSYLHTDPQTLIPWPQTHTGINRHVECDVEWNSEIVERFPKQSKLWCNVVNLSKLRILR